MKSLTILAAAVQNQAAAARREFHPLGACPFWEYPEPGPTTYRDITDDEGRGMQVGIGRFFTSERRDRSQHKFINNRASSNDPRSILPQSLWSALYGSHILRVPTPGDPDEIIYDSLMQSVKENEEKRGYSINSRDPKKRIHRGNQVSQRNIGFPKTMVEIASVMIYCNDRGPMSNCSEHWKTQSGDATINLLQIQNCLIKHLYEVMPDTIRRVFPGETNSTAFLDEAFLFLT